MTTGRQSVMAGTWIWSTPVTSNHFNLIHSWRLQRCHTYQQGRMKLYFEEASLGLIYVLAHVSRPILRQQPCLHLEDSNQLYSLNLPTGIEKGVLGHGATLLIQLSIVVLKQLELPSSCHLLLNFSNRCMWYVITSNLIWSTRFWMSQVEEQSSFGWWISGILLLTNI